MSINFYRLIKDICPDDERADQYLVVKNIFPPKGRDCRECGAAMSFREKDQLFRCQRKASHRNKKDRNESRFHGSLFWTDVKITPSKFLLMAYAFARDLSFDDFIHETSMKEDEQTGRNTAPDWRSFFREIIVMWLEDFQEEQGSIGGPGIVVQIDESKLGHRKYNRSRWLEGWWIFGAIQDGSEDFRVIVCPSNERSWEALKPIIMQHIAPGTMIVSDCWAAYNQIPTINNYSHARVNHSDPEYRFVSANGVHTQRIESSWRPFKYWMRHKYGGDEAAMATFLCEYMWRRWIKKSGQDTFFSLLEKFALVYPGV